MSRAGTTGLRNWFLQRLSAVYIVLFLLAFALIWCGESIQYENRRAWAARPLVNISLILFIAALLIHAWIGLRDVIIDYLKPAALRYAVLVLFALCLVGLALWGLKILLLVSMI